VVAEELGTKRTCPNCGARFYDLNKDPISCPKCEQTFVAEPLLPSKVEVPGAKPKPAAKPEEKKEEGELEEDTSMVSLEDLEEEDTDDETAGIEDVDLGDDESDNSEDEDVFLEDEEDEGGSGVQDLIGGGNKPGSDDS
jgi:uncharacterized protein (TIGR02300 family)